MNLEHNEAAPQLTREAAAEVRVQAALACIQEAQGLVNRAVQALSSVHGLCAEHARLDRLYDQVHRTWYVVRDKADAVKRRGRLALDHEPTRQETEWLSMGGR